MTEQPDPRLSLDLPEPSSGRGLEPVTDRPPAQSFAMPDPSGQRHLIDYVKVLYKRRRLVLSAFLVVFASTVVYTYTRVPIYEARVKILIDAGDTSFIDFREVVDPRRSGGDYYQTQYDLLRSRALAAKTLTSLNLWESFGGSTAAPAQAEATGLRGVARMVRGWFGGGTPAVATTEAADQQAQGARETRQQSRAINRLLSGLSVSPVRNSRIVDLKYRSTDRSLVDKVANAHARSYIEQNMEFKFMSSKEATDWLATQLAEQRKHVQEAESALQQYREKTEVVAADAGDNIVIQKLADLSREVTRAKTQRLEREAVYRQMQAMQGNAEAIDSFPAILSNPVIQGQQAELARLQRQKSELSQKYLDTHPDMEALNRSITQAEQRLRGEIARIVQGVRNEYNSALAAEASLSAALEQQNRAALAMNRTAIQYGVLSREVESARNVYQALLNRSQEAGVSSQVRTTNVRIVDPAEPAGGAVYPRTSNNIMLGFLGGLFLACGLGFFFEYLDSRIKTLDELKVHLRIPPLGMLPLVREGTGTVSPIDDKVSPNFHESLRTLRTNVIFSAPDAPNGRVVAVTSTGPGEGKTVVSSNLAASLSEAGLRVLVIDADMRKPKLHTLFAVPQEPGLSNLIVGTCKASDAVAKTKVPGLWILPAGRLPPNPAELLGSARFRDLLVSVKSHFDWIVIDTPPVMAVADASVLVHAVTGVVFVVGAEMVSRHAATVALDQLENARAKLLGGVLNRVDLDRNPYYYSQYYRKEYRDYYVASQAS